MNSDGDSESWLSRWEQECADDIERQPDFEQSLRLESDNANKKIWTVFQDSATSIAQLYRDRFASDPGALWISFRTAAGTVTSLYKESCEGLRKSSDIAKQSGYQSRNRELLNWAKRKRTLIRRDDLLAYLCGKPPPPSSAARHHSNHHHTHRLSPRPRNISPSPSGGSLVHSHNGHGGADELDTFREALERGVATRNGSPVSSSVRHPPDLCSFITGEMQRHGAGHKRPVSPNSDVIMDSPTHQKRPRYM